MFRGPAFVLLLLASLFVLPGVSMAAEPLPADGNPTDGNALGFAVTTLGESPVELNSRALYGQKPVVLVFWATWCGPCLIEIPHLNALSEKYGDKVQFVGISIDTAPTPAALKLMVQRAAKVRKIGYPIAIDPDGVLATRFKTEAIPYIYGVDLEGNSHELLGLTEEDELAAFIESLT